MDGGALRIHARDLGAYLDRLGNVSHFEQNVEHRPLIYRQFDPGLVESLKPGGAALHRIAAHRKVLQNVAAVAIGAGSKSQVALCLGRGDSRRRQ